MNEKHPRIVFFGTPHFAVPALQALVSCGYAPELVVSAPDKLVGRKQVLTPSPVAVKARELEIPVITPVRLADLQLEGVWDLFVVVAYGKIIPKRILDVPVRGAVNIHPSLLPLFRGAAPIQGALLAGVTETGVTLMMLDEEMDHGPIVAQEKVLLSGTETSVELHDVLAQLGAKMLCDSIPKILSGTATFTEQDHTRASYTKKISTEDGFIDFEKMPALEVDRLVRALNPNPGAYAFFTVGGEKIRTKIVQTRVSDGKLNILLVQPEGKTPVSWEVFKKRIDQTATSGA